MGSPFRIIKHPFIIVRMEPLEPELINLLQDWLLELEGSQFEVISVPAPEPRHVGHKIRVLASANPDWYSKFAAEHQTVRGRGAKRYKRARTCINKVATLSKLRCILAGRRHSIESAGGQRLISYARRWLANQKAKEQAANVPLADREPIWF